MGWTSCHREKGMSDREFFEQEFPNALGQQGRIVECRTINNVFYAAVENNDTASFRPGATWALVVLIKRTRDYWNFTYKEMDETMGPNETRCPTSILDRLSPTDNEYALQWREACRRYAAKGTIRNGDTVRFTSPPNLKELGPMTRCDARAGIFRDQYGRRVRISWWRDAAWELVEAAS